MRAAADNVLLVGINNDKRTRKHPCAVEEINTGTRVVRIYVSDKRGHVEWLKAVHMPSLYDLCP